MVRKKNNIAACSEAQISRLVELFYERVHQDKRLGEIFDTEVSGTWDEHLTKMKSFWRSVLLKTREYHGRPVPMHQKLEGIETQDFIKWLFIFRSTAQEVLEPASAELAIKNAEKIASSLWLSMSKDPFAAPPNWATYVKSNA